MTISINWVMFIFTICLTLLVVVLVMILKGMLWCKVTRNGVYISKDQANSTFRHNKLKCFFIQLHYHLSCRLRSAKTDVVYFLAETAIDNPERVTNESCSFCLDDYGANDQLLILNCRHGYHQTCMFEFLDKHGTSCPICKRGLNVNALYFDLRV